MYAHSYLKALANYMELPQSTCPICGKQDHAQGCSMPDEEKKVMDEVDKLYNNSTSLINKLDPYALSLTKQYGLRDQLVGVYSWAIPTQEAIDVCVKFSPLVEMGAGTGYWANLIQQSGGNIICYDYRDTGRWHPVHFGFPNNIRKHHERNLFLCWPPYDTSMAYNCLRNFKGEFVIYVGESAGGCNGEEAFWHELSKSYKLVTDVSIPQWYGIHDYLMVLKRVK